MLINEVAIDLKGKTPSARYWLAVDSCIEDGQCQIALGVTLRTRSALAVIGMFALGIFVILLAIDGLFLPAEQSAPCQNYLCRGYRVFAEFQALIGAMIAIVAAYFAARPVWLQLRKMNVQQDIMAREIIARRLDAIEARRMYLESKLTELLQEVWRTIYDWHVDPAEYHPEAINPHWAFDRAHTAENIQRELENHQRLKADTILIEEARAVVISRLAEFSECLFAICAPAQYAGDPDLSAEQEAALETESEDAKNNFEKITEQVDSARKRYAETTATEIVAIRSRLREIDDQILQTHDE